MPPVFMTALATGLIALIPKALTDAYDYLFNGEELQVKKKADKTVLTKQNIIDARKAYAVYMGEDGVYTSQRQLTTTLNSWFGTDKSIPQMMRICRSSE